MCARGSPELLCLGTILNLTSSPLLLRGQIPRGSLLAARPRESEEVALLLRREGLEDAPEEADGRVAVRVEVVLVEDRVALEDLNVHARLAAGGAPQVLPAAEAQRAVGEESRRRGRGAYMPAQGDA